MEPIEPIPAELLLAGYSPGIRAQANRLRSVVRTAVPAATERILPGSRLIRYDVPLGKRTRFFAWVMVEPVHVHLGFEYGAWLRDPDRLLEGAHLRLKRVRFLTYVPKQPIPRAVLMAFTRQAASVGRLSAGDRAALSLDRGWEPEDLPD